MMNLLDLLTDQPTMGMPEIAMLRAARRAMATTFEVMLPFGDPRGQFIAEAALDVIDDLEEQLSVYRADSEVSQLNIHATTAAVPVEDRLYQLLLQAAYISHQTGGAFDITTGPLTKAWGFYRREGRVPSPMERSTALSQTGSRFLAFDDSNLTVRYLRSGVEINLGAIGKGYALDRARELLQQEYGVRLALLHGGRSSICGVGRLPNGRGWPIELKHPWNESVQLGVVYLVDQSLGTSSATYQHFEYNGQKLGHVLDPRTGWPATRVQQVSVVAATAALADALSTALFVMGPEATERWCRVHPDVGVVMIVDGEQSPRVWNLSDTMFLPSLPA